MNAPKFSMTNDTVSVKWDGKMHTVRRGAPNFLGLRGALASENWDSIPKHLTVAKSLKEWAKGKFTIEGDVVSFEGTPIPHDINGRIITMATNGEDPKPLFKFWERLQKNPSWRSVQQLWGFIKHENIPITEDGCFLAYKGVNRDYTDKHTSTVDNHPGKVNKLPRNQISDDPNQACHFGFHVGALSYARSFAEQVVVCKVDPEHVVCVPHDASQQKMRVCEYKVIGNWSGVPLASTVHADDNEEDLNGESDVDEENDDVEDIDTSPGTPKAPKAESKKGLGVNPSTLAKMGTKELMEESIDVLRKYAAGTLKIVGASKIPGGKTALVSKIMSTRKNL